MLRNTRHRKSSNKRNASLRFLFAALLLLSSAIAADSKGPDAKKTNLVSDSKVSDSKQESKSTPKPESNFQRIDGITFAVNPGRFYLPVDEAAKLLHWKAEHNEEKGYVILNEKKLLYSELRRLVEGPRLVHMTHLIACGAVIEKSEDGNEVTVTVGNHGFVLVAGEQKTKVDLTTQRLKAWQGNRLVLDCHISSGRHGTPTGDYKAGPYKSRRHYSRLFNGAAMPYSVQFHGHYFVHGFTSVPDYPASHGCIRMHLDQGNPARFFYEWVKVGSPFKVYRSNKKDE